MDRRRGCAIGCWNAKFTYNFWRPVTAIPAGGGIESGRRCGLDTAGDHANHPEYPAATDVSREQRPA